MSAVLLFDDGRADPASALVFSDPVDWIACRNADEVAGALARAEAARREGLFVAGWLAYELGYALEPALATLLPAGSPLLRLGLWRPPRRLVGDEIDAFLTAEGGGRYTLGEVSPSWDFATYRAAFASVRDYIAAGDVYQVNLTFPLSFAFSGDAVAFYRDLRDRARAGHAALFKAPDETVLSLSPELFVAIEHGRIRTRPMKGTAARAPGSDDDLAAAAALAADDKQRAENLMIVDLLRSDLGRIAEIGSVRVDDLFTVETYPTLHTLTSGVSARLKPGAGLHALLRAIFPCGSVTGAPKVRAMQIIRELEAGPRGIYCGALGWLAPNGDGAFNVAIRTLHLPHGGADGVGRMGVGSGVTFDSNAADEYEECLLKARFVGARSEPFGLIETMLWQAEEGYALLDRHLARLAASARYFQFRYDERRVRAALARTAAGLASGAHRVRLVLAANGGIDITSAAIPPTDAAQPVTFVLAERRVSSRDPFFHHKTTRRDLYDGEFARLTRDTGCDEVLFLNERGELTEGSRSNLFVARAGVLLTPPLDAGVLPGCLRAELIARAEPEVLETTLLPADLAGADAIFLGNSVRGLRPAVAHAISAPSAAEAG